MLVDFIILLYASLFLFAPFCLVICIDCVPSGVIVLMLVERYNLLKYISYIIPYVYLCVKTVGWGRKAASLVRG